MAEVRLGFHGSRSLSDERVRIIVLEEIEKHCPTVIVTHAEPGGVCEMVRKIAQEKAIPLKLHFLNFKFLRGAFEHRSKAVLADSDVHVFIHDGESKGTSNEINVAKKRGLNCVVHTISVTKHKSSVGFDIDIEWDAADNGQFFPDIKEGLV